MPDNGDEDIVVQNRTVKELELEVSRLDRELRLYRAGGRFGLRAGVLLLLGPSLSRALAEWITGASTGNMNAAATADVVAAIVRRFVRVLTVGSVLAMIPLALLWCQNGLLDHQNQLVSASNQILQSQFREQTQAAQSASMAQFLATVYDVCTDCEVNAAGELHAQASDRARADAVRRLVVARASSASQLGADWWVRPFTAMACSSPADLTDMPAAIGGLPLRNLWAPCVAMDGSNLANSALTQADLRRASFVGADLHGSDLSGADLTDANLAGANLSKANLCDVDLTRASLEGAVLTGARLCRAQLVGANLSHANLESVDASKANFSGANLVSAQLSRAHLVQASFESSCMRHAVLTGATLSGTDFSGADLVRTWLDVADPLDGRFEGSLWTVRKWLGVADPLDGRLDGSLWNDETTWPPGYSPLGAVYLERPDPGVHVVVPGDTLASIGADVGMSVEALIELNGVTADGISVGQRLTVWSMERSPPCGATFLQLTSRAP